MGTPPSDTGLAKTKVKIISMIANFKQKKKKFWPKNNNPQSSEYRWIFKF